MVIAADTVLAKRESEGNPVRVAMVGAGVTARMIALQLATPVPGMRMVAIANRTVEKATRAC
jgi:predicted homoserine dehydrogenase-like protein